MREESSKDFLVELFNFNQENRLDFYAFVRVILEQSQCAIISKPYWPVTDGNPGSEVFTIFPDLQCSACDGYKCQEVDKLTIHAIQCLTRKGVRSSQAHEDLHFFKKYGIVPKSVKKLVDDARDQRDLNAVCIAPVLDHPTIRGLADLQRKERERKLTEIANETQEEARGPNGPIIKLAKGAEMPLDRMVWIQTPLTSELATLLLAGMQPIRHSPRGIHLPIIMRDTGVNKVIHLHVDRFEEFAAVRMAEQNWEIMKVELEQIGHHHYDPSHAQFIPDLMTGDTQNSFNKIIGRNLKFKRPNDLITEQKFEQKMRDDINKERKKVENSKRKEEGLKELKHMTENEAARKATAANSNDRNLKVNGDCSSSHREPSDRPGCSKYI